MGSSLPEDRSTEETREERTPSLLYESRLTVFTLLAVLPGVLTAALLIALSPWPTSWRMALILLLCMVSGVLMRVLRKQIIHPLHTLANVVAALREEDFSFRARGATAKDPLGQLALEINTLAELLAAHNTRTVEATALLRRVMDVVDVPMFAFDPAKTLRLVNSAGERLLHKPAAALLGRRTEQLGLSSLMLAGNQMQISLPQTPEQKWFVRRSQFRQNGVPHTLLVLADVSRVIREEERSAWQRLIRVLGHELNNSLTPIKSIAGTLAARLGSLPIDEQDKLEFRRGLGIMESRAASLNRFLQAYRRLAQMPRPSLAMCSLKALVERTAALESRVPVKVEAGPDVQVEVDADQVEQLLINLIKNAAEATLEAKSSDANDARVTVGWSVSESQVALTIRDHGPGLLNPDNAFVPFYTTKQEGTGIGLVLSRQIAEAHDGRLRLANREDGSGCTATLVLPIGHRQASGSGHAVTKTAIPS